MVTSVHWTIYTVFAILSDRCAHIAIFHTNGHVIPCNDIHPHLIVLNLRHWMCKRETGFCNCNWWCILLYSMFSFIVFFFFFHFLFLFCCPNVLNQIETVASWHYLIGVVYVHFCFNLFHSMYYDNVCII